MSRPRESPRPLRFAPLIRVSGEEQARLGESLSTQGRQIAEAVAKLGGEIPEKIANRYSGQEHATPGYERRLLDLLLADAAKGLFDAVMVADISRWSRDNERSKEGLKVFRKHGIRFFVLTTEHDLHNAEAELALSFFAVINQYLAKTQVKKAVDNRLARLRRGCPACGSMPYGRTFDKATETWGIDPEKKELLQSIAERYVAGESLAAMAKEHRMNFSSLWRALLKQSGPLFVVLFNKLRLDGDRARKRYRGGQVDQMVADNIRKAERIHAHVREIELEDLHIFLIDVPPMLDGPLLERVKEVAGSRRKSRGKRNRPYLLGGHIYCAECERTLSGQTQIRRGSKQYRYYRHMPTQRVSGDGCPHVGLFCDADAVEEAVILHLFATIGNAAKIEKAVQAANPDAEAQEKARDEIQAKLAELKSVGASKDRLVDAVAEGRLTGDAIDRRMKALEQTEEAIQVRLEHLHEIVGGAPAPNVVKAAAEYLAGRRRVPKGKVRENAALGTATDPGELERMTWEEKRRLVELFFVGKGVAGQKLGVFIRRPDDYEPRKRNQSWEFEIRGRFTLAAEFERVPLSEKQRAALRGEVAAGTADSNLKGIYANFAATCAGRTPPESRPGCRVLRRRVGRGR